MRKPDALPTGRGGTRTWDGSSESNDYQPADGAYTIRVTAEGFEPLTIEFEIANPTNCGCCGCCPGKFADQVDLVPGNTDAGTP